MSVEVTCDGCGKKQTMRRLEKPREWFIREDEDGIQLACSRPCVEETARVTGKTGLVLPW